MVATRSSSAVAHGVHACHDGDFESSSQPLLARRLRAPLLTVSSSAAADGWPFPAAWLALSWPPCAPPSSNRLTQPALLPHHHEHGRIDSLWLAGVSRRASEHNQERDRDQAVVTVTHRTLLCPPPRRRSPAPSSSLAHASCAPPWPAEQSDLSMRMMVWWAASRDRAGQMHERDRHKHTASTWLCHIN